MLDAVGMQRPSGFELTMRLGLPPGETLTRLIELAYEIDPVVPEDAFADIPIVLDWIAEDAPEDVLSTLDPIPGLTPDGVKVFARTAVSLGHFGFVVGDDSQPTDSLPIVYADRDGARVVAANLTDLLSLLAWGGAACLPFADSWPCEDGARYHEAACEDAEEIGRPKGDWPRVTDRQGLAKAPNAAGGRAT